MKKNLYITYMLAAGLAFSGCKKSYLDTFPAVSIESSGAFSSPSRVNAAMIGLYDLMQPSQFTNHIFLTADVKGGDELIVLAGNYNRFVTEYQFTEVANGGTGALSFIFWKRAFEMISSCNQAITNIPKAPIAEDVKTDYLAEARTLRAWANHQLVRLYAQPYAVNPDGVGIPKVDKPLKADDPTPTRSSVKDIYAFMLDDLKFAEQSLSNKRTNSYRITLNAVYALQARLYLDMGKWAEASAYAKKARAGFPLEPGTTLLKGFVDKTPEWIWGLNYRTDDNTGFLMLASFQEPYDIGYSTFRASKSFLTLFADNDIRKKQFYVNVGKVANGKGDALQRDDIVFSRDGYLMNKFYYRSTLDLDMPLIRSAEMYLVEAEAESELNNDAAAQTALFEVQKRAITGAVKSVNTGDALKTEIENERRKELFGEGFRFFDIIRRKKTLTRDAADHWKPIVLQPNDTHNVLPIPQRELDISHLEQNKGYN
ncbi:RagB/SusD family nutrient uptake outer membrane protein [Chitinophaga qingshengii]|uniref:RagB/SusD family nutrient uptake outer membrane protein n=1 Tax=Chitinophaga qingshengii TaxID=1569794 RepID=A0ABR7TH04_9BACT|nr:RagB/SusD family nutrient uptake outer membrane protein [Chitinophaga qingshengii]MBC9929767.1 RagB/SusD family nutrient uptake outer membrane protein [Chitinophaga qingshengii]